MRTTILVTLLASIPLLLFSEEKTQDVEKISESMGHLIGKNLENLGLKFDLDKVIQGMRDAANGKTPPLTEEQCVDAIALIQEKTFHQEAEKNLEKATAFLEENAKKQEVVELESGKLQYRIETKGKGKPVEKTSSPLVRYTGKYLDGSIFGSSEEGERIALEETIPGFKEGILGMKEGEKRTLFIHPDLGYGTNGFLKPNSLLTFEIEVLQANVENEHVTAEIEHENPELARPELENSSTPQ